MMPGSLRPLGLPPLWIGTLKHDPNPFALLVRFKPW